MAQRISLIILAVLLTVGTVRAEEKDANSTLLKWQPNVELSFQYRSKYVVSGGSDLSNDKPVIQSELNLSWSNGMWLDVWQSVGLNDSSWNSDFSDELDFSVGWSGKIGWLDVTAFVCYFDNFNLLTSQGDQILAVGKISHSFKLNETHGITPYASISGYFPIDKSGPENGMYLSLGVEHSWAITKDVTLRHGPEILKDDGAMGNDKGLLGKYKATLSWQITEWVAIEGGLDIFVPLTMHDQRQTEVVWGTGLRFKF